MPASPGASKSQPITAQDALVRICAQEAFHQHREPGPGLFRTVIDSAS
jgi:hypothetical protein